jgi:hypothetical protein
MILVLTNDGKIRAVDQFILDVVSEIQADNDICINTMSDGPCLTHVGIYELLDKICDRFHFDRRRISIITPNLIESHSEYLIKKDFNFWELERAIVNSQKFANTDKVFDAEFKHFGNFIGHSNKY